MADTIYNPKISKATPAGGMGVWEENYAPYAGPRTVSIIHDLNTGSMAGDWIVGTVVAGTVQTDSGVVSIAGTPALPIQMLPPSATFAARGIINFMNIAPMALVLTVLDGLGVAGTRRLRAEIYGRNQFGKPIMEVFDVTMVSTGSATSAQAIGKKIYAFVDSIKITNATGFQAATDAFQIGPYLGDGNFNAGGALVNANVNPRFALPCRVSGKEDIMACLVEVWGNQATVPYTAGQGAANFPTPWRLGQFVYQGASLAAANCKGILTAAWDTSDITGINTKVGTIMIRRVLGQFQAAVPIKQDFDASGGAAAGTTKATGAVGQISTQRTWDQTLDFVNYRNGEKMTVDADNSSIFLSNAGTGFESNPITAEGWQAAHVTYRVIITVRSTLGIPGRGAFQKYWKPG